MGRASTLVSMIPHVRARIDEGSTTSAFFPPPLQRETSGNYRWPKQEDIDVGNEAVKYMWVTFDAGGGCERAVKSKEWKRGLERERERGWMSVEVEQMEQRKKDTREGGGWSPNAALQREESERVCMPGVSMTRTRPAER